MDNTRSAEINDVFESLSHPIYVINADDYTVEMANSAAYRGQLKDQTKCYALAHGRAAPCVDDDDGPCPLATIKETKQPFVTEHFHFDRDGKRKVFEVHGHPILDHEGNVVRIIELTFDVTERKRDAEALAQSERRYRILIETMAEGLAVIDENATITYVNSQFCQMLGYAQDELTGRNASELLDEDSQQSYETEFARRKSGESSVYETLLKCKDGKRLPVILSASPLPMPDGSFKGSFAVFTDISERAKAEAELRNTTQLLETVFSHTHMLVAYLDPEFNFIRVNPVYAAADERDPAFYPGKNHFDLYPDAGNEAIFRRVVETGEPYFTYAKPFEYAEHPERGVSYWDWSLIPILDADSAVTGLVLTLLDVTERRRTEDDLHNVTHDLRERVKELNCLYGISRLAGKENASLADILQGTVDLLPPAWKYPEVTCARIVLEGQDFRTQNFAETKWKQAADLSVYGERVGAVQVYYLEEREEADEGPFLKEERNLLGAVTERVGRVIQRVRAEAALRESEKKYRQLVEIAQEGVWVIDADAKTTFVNPRMAEMLGYTMEEMIGQHLHFFMDERGVEITERNLERRRQGIVEQHDFEFLRKDGTRIFTSLETTPMYDEDGTYIGGLALVADITERRRAEEALRRAHDELEIRVQQRTAELETTNQALQAEIAERKQVEAELRASEERFRQLAEHINEVFWITDLNENRLLYISPAYERLWGQPREDLYQHPESFPDGVHPEDRERVLAINQRQLREETDETYRILPPDGSVRWIRARTFPIWNVLGQVYRVAGIAEDITERVQAYQLLEQRVLERTRELSTLLDISRQVALTPELEPLLDLILDQLQSVVAFDDASIFRLEMDDLVAQAHRGTVPSNQMLRQRYSLQKAPFGRDLILNRETVIIPDVRGDTRLARDFRDVTGEQFELLYGQVRSWMAVPLAIQDQVLGILTLKHREPNHFIPDQVDLVEGFASQAAVAIENRRLYERARELAALEERQRLARDLHDAVSQTLFSASLAAEVLPRLWERRPDEGRRCLEELRQLTRGALAEMRTLLLELRPAALTEVNLDDLLRQLVEAISGRARIPVELTVDGDCSVAPGVQVTFYRIAQEALSNIVKHSQASHVSVSLRCLPADDTSGGDAMQGAVELRVEDNGRGFERDSVALDCLGLCIMEERAAAIGAELDIQSQVGGGTQVFLSWSDAPR